MDYQVVVIGSGPGGYVAAIRCAQLGFKTALVEKYDSLGGTCLNVGCIPSKALLDSTEHFHLATHGFKEHGINATGVKPDFTQMVKRKGEVVGANVEGVAYLMRKNKIEVVHGTGTFKDKHTLTVTAGDGAKQELTAEKFIIATGSKPTALPFAPFDGKKIISSTEALSLTKIPKALLVIGGGVIGMELGSVYARLGTKVTIVEYLDSLIPTMDAGLGRELKKVGKKLGMDIHTGFKVTAVETKGRGVVVSAEPAKGGEAQQWTADHCLVSVGRRPYTEGLGLENVGVQVEKGFIKVDASLCTTAPNIFAIGDVIGGAMLAHKAEEEGVFVAEHLHGQKPHIHYHLIPSVVYTWPEVAAVGFSEKQLKQEGRAYKKGTFPYKALGRARASMDLDGFVKVLADKQTDEILGVHIIGARAADMIASAVTAMEYRAAAEDVARMSHAHPTYMEAFKEACLAATENRPLHL